MIFMGYRAVNHDLLAKNGFVLASHADWVPEFTGKEDEKLRYVQELRQRLSASCEVEVYVAQAIDESNKPTNRIVIYKKVI